MDSGNYAENKMSILRHVNNELLLALWLLQQMVKDQKEYILLEHSLLCALFNQSRISDKRIGEFSKSIEPIFPCVKVARDFKGRTVLHLHPTKNGAGLKWKSISKLPKQEEAEDAIGIRWKKVIIDDYTPDRKEAYSVHKEEFRFKC